MLKQVKNQVIGISISTLIVWSFIVILYLCGKNPLDAQILMVAGIILPVLLLFNIYLYNLYLNDEKKNQKSKNEINDN